jgi:hypothetical protein
MLRHCGLDDLADQVAAHPEKVEDAMAEVRDLMAKAAVPTN